MFSSAEDSTMSDEKNSLTTTVYSSQHSRQSRENSYQSDTTIGNEVGISIEETNHSSIDVNILTPPPSRRSGEIAYNLRANPTKPNKYQGETIKRNHSLKQKQIKPILRKNPPRRNSQHNILRKPFEELIKEILHKESNSKLRISAEAVDALHETAEELLINMFESLGRLAAVEGQSTVTLKTYRLYVAARSDLKPMTL